MVAQDGPCPPCGGRARLRRTRRAGAAGFATVQAGGEPYRLRSRSGDRPARGAIGTPLGAGRGLGWRGRAFGGNIINDSRIRAHYCHFLQVLTKPSQSYPPKPQICDKDR
jgi:hypothetical protein